MDGTKDTRHGIEDTDPHMGMVEREKDAEHRTQRIQDTGDTQGMYTHAYRNKEDAKQRLQKRCSTVRTVKKRDSKAWDVVEKEAKLDHELDLQVEVHMRIPLQELINLILR